MTLAGGGPSSNLPASVSKGQSTNLGDILERVLDKGLVIAGDIQVNLLDIELLTIKIRLVVASLETAREAGIDWWEHDPWLSGKSSSELERENQRLTQRIAELESGSVPSIDAERQIEVEGRRSDHE